jgi:N-acetyl-alpha-D-muramate 1-phosphate uridylyltransferase
MTHHRPTRAIVLAAGLGQRMRPITLTLPKPLVTIGGKPMLDHALDRLADAGITDAVVNVHWLADKIEAHVADRRHPRIMISDERDALLETGGGVLRALPLLGAGPFLTVNSDSLWAERDTANIAALVEAWDQTRMDVLLLLAERASSYGYEGRGDFERATDGSLARRKPGNDAPFIYAGVAIIKPELMSDMPEGAFSLNLVFDKALSAGRLMGRVLDGIWLHVGTPEAIPEADARFRKAMQPGRGK